MKPSNMFGHFEGAIGMYHLIVGGDPERSFQFLDDAKAAAMQRAYGLTAHSGKTEEVIVKKDDKYIGTASGHISASWRGE
jgi:hypothetical protein